MPLLIIYAFILQPFYTLPRSITIPTTIWDKSWNVERNVFTITPEGIAHDQHNQHSFQQRFRRYHPVFHQIDGLCVSHRSEQTYTTDDLTRILVDIATAIYGNDVGWRVSGDSFPFTDPSIQLEIQCKDSWTEVLGAGLVNPKVLEMLGISSVEYNGWAFGYGLDRLAMIKMHIPDIRILWSEDQRVTRQFKNIESTYTEVSKYPSVDRDISFVVDRRMALNSFYELVRDCGCHENEDIIEEVNLIETYANEKKFGHQNVSYTFRIRYRSHVRTLTNDEINNVQETVRLKVVSELGAMLR